MNNQSSLQKVTGKSSQELAQLKVNSDLAFASGESPKSSGENFMEDRFGASSNKRTIVIEKEGELSRFSNEKAFEIVVEKLGKTIDSKREEVENALIITGSPVKVRGLNRKKFNAEVQNRLSSNTQNGKQFRDLMTILMGSLYAKALHNDGFFRAKSELKYSVIGDDISGLATKPASTIENPAPEILPLKKTEDGGVAKDPKAPQDWGSILSGSASVIQSIGGVIGLFSGGKPATQDENVFNSSTSNEIPVSQADDQDKARKKKLIQTVIGLFLLAIGIGVVIYFVRKKK